MAVIADVIYWSKEKVGPKVVVSVTDLVISQVADGSAVEYAAASKQIYASRVDAFHGWFGSIARRLVRHRAPGAVARSLRRAKERLESATRLARS